MTDAPPAPAAIGFDDFLKVEVRVGTVLSAAPNRAARKPAYVLEVDFGPALGRKTTSAQLTERYTAGELVGRQVAAVVNFPPKRIAGVKSEVLVLGFPDAQGHVVLVGVDRPVPDGGRLF
ncbi:MAG TPA: tRNA-binding protein [Geminicoccaceae bacterium]|nr:tRNA-binding protein [Geminicoccaceae bacterium]